jgi:tRNA threonylcarbamoyladenosine biosynthesis protein TsaB
MKLLAFDTSTEVMSIAVSRDDNGALQTWSHTGAGGAQASLTLIGTVMELLELAGLPLKSLDALCFGSGPGSFTGLRTACAVAQGLAFGADLPVLPVSSLWALAEDARYTYAPDAESLQVMSMLDARMEEIYAANLSWRDGVWHETAPAGAFKPEALALPVAQRSQVHPLAPIASVQCLQALAGNVFERYADRLPVALAGITRWNASPTAQAMLRLAPLLLGAGGAVAPELALPTYVRDKVAQTSAERAAVKLQQSGVRE